MMELAASILECILSKKNSFCKLKMEEKYVTPTHDTSHIFLAQFSYHSLELLKNLNKVFFKKKKGGVVDVVCFFKFKLILINRLHF